MGFAYEMKYHFNKKRKLKNLSLETFYAEIEKAVRELSAEQFPAKRGINMMKEYKMNKKIIIILSIDLWSYLRKVKSSE